MRYDLKPLVEDTSKINISTTIRKLVLDLNDAYLKIHNKKINLAVEDDVVLFVELVNRSISLNQKIGETYTKQNPIKVTFTKSNLQRGFIFWFVCNRCSSKVRHLYCPQHSEDFLCRKCHRLAYAKQNKKSDREVAKLLNDPFLMARYMQSGSWKQNLYALDAMFMREEIEKRAIERINASIG